MAQVIIYPEGSSIAIITPATDQLTVSQIALKDVPSGVSYRIVDDSTLPTDRSTRAAWTADFSSPDGTGLGPTQFYIQEAGGTLPP